MHLPPVDYSISSVSGPVDDGLRREAAAFWLAHGAIPDAQEAQRRADELVCIARNPANEIVGVNTAYVANLPGEDRRYWFYRMFLRPQDRQVRLSMALMRAAVATLRARAASAPRVRGVLLVTENQKLMRASGRRMLTRLGWKWTGSDRRGLDVWRVEFE